MTQYFLASERLRFRCWTETDLPLATALWQDPEVTHFLGGIFTLEAVRARLSVEMERQHALGVQYWPIFHRGTGEHVGCAGLRPFHGPIPEERVYEVGVHIARRFWSGRFGEEAARAVIDYGFRTVQARALTAGHHPRNRFSEALIRRLGFDRTHEAPWGEQGLLHPFYRLEPPTSNQ